MGQLRVWFGTKYGVPFGNLILKRLLAETTVHAPIRSVRQVNSYNHRTKTPFVYRADRTNCDAKVNLTNVFPEGRVSERPDAVLHEAISGEDSYEYNSGQIDNGAS